jgi:single-stranded-DNA-specific exonuclease
MIGKKLNYWFLDRMNNLIKNFVNEFRKIQEPIKIVSHLDADGLTSAAIISKALVRNGNEFSLSIVRQLDRNIIKELSLENYNYFLFMDLGSGFLSLINEHLKDRKIFILDHHIPENVETDFIHINPHLLGLDSWSISGAGLAYLFVKELNENNKDLAYISVIGGAGDYINFNQGFSGSILKDAVDSGKLEIKKGLRMFGTQTRYLHKLLQYSTDPYIPGVTGNEEGAITFLNELGINYKDEKGNFKRLNDLSDEELKELVTGVILKRFGSEEHPEDVLGDVYLLKGEEDESYTKDVKEYATLLNACGRLKRPSLGIGTFMENPTLKEKANELLKSYKLEIINALNWFHRNKENFIRGDKFIIINAEDNIKDSMIGTLCGIISNSNIYDRNFVIVGMAYTVEGDIKISMRTNNINVDLREIIKIVADGGGHSNACGAFIKKEQENEFIDKMRNILTKDL